MTVLELLDSILVTDFLTVAAFLLFWFGTFIIFRSLVSSRF